MIDNITSRTPKADAQEISRAFAQRLHSIELSYVVRERSDGPFLVFEIAAPAERFFRLLEQTLEEIPEENQFKERTTISRRSKSPPNRLAIPEAELLIATISESLTIDRHSFEEDFFSRYTRSVTNLERQITANANFLVYGRRGSGKSSLLAYAMNGLKEKEQPFAWVALQTYAGRTDDALIAGVLSECVDQLGAFISGASERVALASTLNDLASVRTGSVMRHIFNILPRVRTFFAQAVPTGGAFTIFLDDLHVLGVDQQPRLLGAVYSTTRGNRGFIKTSAIEQLCRPWDSASRTGLEPTQDIQLLKLDYNLTMPDRSKQHIVGILDAQARYCGMPDINYLANDLALSRLVWVAAAVPRDAMNLFSIAVQKGIAKGERRVSATSVNAAASEMAEAKLREIDLDATSDREKIIQSLERVKTFCVSQQRKNAFLVEIKNSDPLFQSIQKLIALRLVHILHEGITPHEASRRYMALMLDYGFYVGIRAARSVDQFQTEPARILAKDLRKLPVLPLETG